MNYLENIINRSKKRTQSILLPDSNDERILQAAAFCQKEKIANITLLGEKEKIALQFKELGLELGSIDIISYNEYKEEFCQQMLDLKPDISLEIAKEKLEKPLCYGAFLLRNNKVQGMVAGATFYSSEVIKAALDYIPKKEEKAVISSSFLAFLEDKSIGENGLLCLADCAVIVNPNLRQLVQITISSAETMEKICNVKAKAAMLSFSTKKSSEHRLSTKMAEATDELKQKNIGFLIDGELQIDAAIIPEIAMKKAPNSPLRGRANLLIFPDLNSGNIGYKIIQRIGKAKVIGPILQGFKLPINDLSRGCSLDEIINMIAVTNLQVK